MGPATVFFHKCGNAYTLCILCYQAFCALVCYPQESMIAQPLGYPVSSHFSKGIDYHESQRRPERRILELPAHSHQRYAGSTDSSGPELPDQPDPAKGNNFPSSSAKISLRFGNPTMNAAGTPSTSAIAIASSGTSRRRLFPSSANSALVKGTNPQLSDQASLNIWPHLDLFAELAAV